MTFWLTVERGEYVMIALAVVLIITVVIWWVRALRLSKEMNSYPGLMQRIRDHVVEGDLDNARQICGSNPSAGARVVEAGLHRVGHKIEEVVSAMKYRSDIEKEMMKRGCRWLYAFAVISPLAGLGGTLVGIIDRLRDLGESGVPVELSSVCSAIAPTIVTTVAGLGVGIFALIALTALEARIDAAERKLEELQLDFIDLLNEPG